MQLNGHFSPIYASPSSMLRTGPRQMFAPFPLPTQKQYQDNSSIKMFKSQKAHGNPPTLLTSFTLTLSFALSTLTELFTKHNPPKGGPIPCFRVILEGEQNSEKTTEGPC